MIDHTRLTRGRGWTDALIERYLGEEDAAEPHPYRRGQGMRLYNFDRVLRAEKRDDVRADLQAVAAERKERADALKRLAELRETFADVIEAVPIFVTSVASDDLRQRTIAAYGEWTAQHGKIPKDVGDLRFLSWLMLNFVRRELVDYRPIIEAFAGNASEADIRRLVDDRVRTKILSVYPQIMVRKRESSAARVEA